MITGRWVAVGPSDPRSNEGPCWARLIPSARRSFAFRFVLPEIATMVKTAKNRPLEGGNSR
jgi:hypothetical protein